MADMNTAFQNILASLSEQYRPLRRNHGLPYITHPLEVMCAVKSMPEKILALIHDYGEFRDAAELAGLGVPEDLILKAQLLAKQFPDNIKEDDPLYREYLWNLLSDSMCRKIKYFDLATNGGFEESPIAVEKHVSGEYPHAMALLVDVADGKLYFKSKSFMFNVFSNFYPVELVIDGETWRSAEHFYQAAKFSKNYGVSKDNAIYEAIRNAESAGDAKQIADENFDENCRQIWNRALRKFASTTLMLNAKFALGTEARKRLKQTGDLCLIHESKDDFFWGQTRDGQERNILGKVLMQMRENDADCFIVNLIGLAAEGK